MALTNATTEPAPPPSGPATQDGAGAATAEKSSTLAADSQVATEQEAETSKTQLQREEENESKETGTITPQNATVANKEEDPLEASLAKAPALARLLQQMSGNLSDMREDNQKLRARIGSGQTPQKKPPDREPDTPRVGFEDGLSQVAASTPVHDKTAQNKATDPEPSSEEQEEASEDDDSELEKWETALEGLGIGKAQLAQMMAMVHLKQVKESTTEEQLDRSVAAMRGGQKNQVGDPVLCTDCCVNLAESEDCLCLPCRGKKGKKPNETNKEGPVDTTGIPAVDRARQAKEELAQVSSAERLKDINKYMTCARITSWDKVEERRAACHVRVNQLRKLHPEEFVELSVDNLLGNILNTGGFSEERMLRLIQLFLAPKAPAVPFEEHRGFHDQSIYENKQVVYVIHELLGEDEMKTWLQGERDVTFDETNEVPRLPRASNRHKRLRRKARIMLAFLDVMEATPGVMGPFMPTVPKHSQYHARPIWHLQNWIYSYQYFDRQPKKDAGIRHLRQRVRYHCEMLDELALGFSIFLRSFATEENSDIRAKVRSLAELKAMSCGESEHQEWPGQAPFIVSDSHRDDLMTDLTECMKLVHKIASSDAANSTPGILELPRKERMEPPTGSFKNVSRDGYYINESRPPEDSDSGSAIRKERALHHRAVSRHARIQPALNQRGQEARERDKKNANRETSLRSERRKTNKKSARDDSGSEPERRSGPGGWRPPNRNNGGGPPDDDPPDDDDEEEDDDTSEDSDDSTDSESEEERRGRRRGRRARKKRGQRATSRSVSFGRRPEPPCRKCGSETHATGSNKCKKRLEFCGYCNKTTHSYKNCIRKNGAQCGDCHQPAHSDEEDCPVRKAEAYNRNLGSMFREPTKLDWPQYQARLRLGSDIAGNLIRPAIKLPPSQLATHQKQQQDKERQRAHMEMKLAKRIEESSALEKTTLIMQSNEAFNAALLRAMEMTKCTKLKEFKEKYPKMHENLVSKNTEQYSSRLMKSMSGEAYKNVDGAGMGWTSDVVFHGTFGEKYSIDEFFNRFEIAREANKWGDDVSAHMISTRLRGAAKIWFDNLLADEETSISAQFFPNLKALMLNKYEEDLNVFVRTRLMQDVRWDPAKYKGCPSSFFEDIVNRTHKIFKGRPDHELVQWKVVREAEAIDKFIREVPPRLIEKMREANVDDSVEGFRQWLERFEKMKRGLAAGAEFRNRGYQGYQVHAVDQKEDDGSCMDDGLMSYWNEDRANSGVTPPLEVDAVRRNPEAPEDRKCYECGQKGHIARDCPRRTPGEAGGNLQTQAVMRRRAPPYGGTSAGNSRPRLPRKKGPVAITRLQGSTRKSHLQKGKRYFSTASKRRYQVNAINTPESLEDFHCIGQLEDLEEDDGQVGEEFEHQLVAMPEEVDASENLEAAALRGPGRTPQGASQMMGAKTSADRDRSETAAISREVDATWTPDDGNDDDPYGVNYRALSYGGDH